MLFSFVCLYYILLLYVWYFVCIVVRSMRFSDYWWAYWYRCFILQFCLTAHSISDQRRWCLVFCRCGVINVQRLPKTWIQASKLLLPPPRMCFCLIGWFVCQQDNRIRTRKLLDEFVSDFWKGYVSWVDKSRLHFEDILQLEPQICFHFL